MKKSTSIFQKFVKRGINWAAENRKITIPAGVGIIVVIVVLIAVTANLNKNKVQKTDAKAGTTSVSEDETVKEEPLEENAYPEVNKLIDKYYQALADGDMAVVEQCRNYTEETEKIRLKKKSQYIDSYQNILVYTKKGILENTYLAYVYYEVKFQDIETSAPAMNSLYICPNENGDLYIYEGEIDDNVSAFIKEMSTQDNVLELFNRVDVKYSEAVASDENLSKFLEELPTKIKTEVGEALAAGETLEDTVSDNTLSENKVEETPEEAPPAETPVVQPVVIETVQTTDTVNVRSSDSETADKVGKALSGEQFKRLETKENGWSKIEFEGKEAYVKTEFLTVVDTATQAVVTPPAEETPKEAPAETPKETPSETIKSPEGMVTVKETVNVRKATSETSEKLGLAYKGEQYELIMKQADGWSKIKYNGKTGYVKNEFVE